MYFVYGLGSGLLIMFMRVKFTWWQFHPAGYAMGYSLRGTYGMLNWWFMFFVAWLIKTTLTRYGSGNAYHRSRPFFIGLIAGFFMGVGISYGIDLIWFFGKGHPILNG